MTSTASPAPAVADCKHPPGRFAPVIDANRCEGKAACAAECPFDVFVVRRHERSELPSLSLLGTLKWWVHGGVQAQALRADQCRGCGRCVNACPESAITLVRTASMAGATSTAGATGAAEDAGEPPVP